MKNPYFHSNNFDLTIVCPNILIQASPETSGSGWFNCLEMLTWDP